MAAPFIHYLTGDARHAVGWWVRRAADAEKMRAVTCAIADQTERSNG